MSKVLDPVEPKSTNRKVTTSKIKDFALGIYDGPHATPKESSEGAIFLGIKNVTEDGRLDFSEIKYVSEQELPKWTKRVTPQKDDIVFSYEATLHRYAVIPDGFRGCLGRRMALVRPDKSKVHPRFLHFYFLSSKWRAVIESNIINGATVDRIPLTKFPDFEVQFPDLETQQKIASILSAYDDLIENNRRRIALLEQAARLLYQEWFVHFRFPGHEHVRLVDGLPEGWEKRKLSEIAICVMGQSPKSEFYNKSGEGFPFHQGVTNFGFRFVEHETYCTIKGRLAEPGDILCSVRAPVGRLNIALDQLVIGRGLSALRSKSGHQTFFFYQLKNHFFKEDLIGHGAIYAATNKDELNGQEFIYPSKDLIHEFEEVAKPLDEQVKALYLQNMNLIKARDILLPRLMNGELGV